MEETAKEAEEEATASRWMVPVRESMSLERDMARGIRLRLVERRSTEC